MPRRKPKVRAIKTDPRWLSPAQLRVQKAVEAAIKREMNR